MVSSVTYLFASNEPGHQVFQFLCVVMELPSAIEEIVIEDDLIHTRGPRLYWLKGDLWLRDGGRGKERDVRREREERQE